jgi:hypothetical protein
VHHCGNTDGTVTLGTNAVALLDVGNKVSVCGLKARPDVLERVGPNAVDELVLPLVTSDGENNRRVVTDEAGLDASGAEFDPEGDTSAEDELRGS